MGRLPRQASPLDAYNIGLKGHNSADVFQDDKDRAKFLECLRFACEKYEVKTTVWTLMSNHVHMIMEGELPNISRVFISLGSRYVRWYNRRHWRSGTLWDRRFYSDPIKDEQAYLEKALYIFANPVKAKMVDDAQKYAWSTCKYLKGGGGPFSKSLLSVVYSAQQIIEFVKAKDEKLLANVKDVITPRPLQDDETRQMAREMLSGKETHEFEREDDGVKQKIVKKLLDTGSNIAQLARIFGVSRLQISRLIC